MFLKTKKASIIFLVVVFSGIFAIAETSWAANPEAVASGQFKVVGYYTVWSNNESTIKLQYLTHINYAFLEPKADGTFKMWGDHNTTDIDILVTRAHANGIKVLIAVGGGDPSLKGIFDYVAKNDSLRSKFITNLDAFVTQHNLDGVDIDWEHPSYNYFPNGFTILMSELDHHFHSKGKLLTTAVDVGYNYGESFYNNVDFVNLMTYGLLAQTTKNLDYWQLGHNLPQSKSMVGIHLDLDTTNPYYQYGNLTMPQAIEEMKKKTILASSRAGGVMLWHLDFDKYNLIQTIYDAIPSVLGDVTPPGAPVAVRDSAGPDASFTYSKTELSANWDAVVDTESEIVEYQYAIGTSAGGTNIVNWTSDGKETKVTRSGLNLNSDTTYYFSVRAKSGGGIGPARNSNGQIIRSSTDTTPPSAPPAVRDGDGADINFVFSSEELSANWDAVVDSESDIVNYKYAIGKTSGGTDVADWTSVGNATEVARSGLSLEPNRAYYFSVKGESAGGAGPSRNSDGQTARISGQNLALKKTAIASSVNKENYASYAVDGSVLNNRWISIQALPQSIYVNLGQKYDLGGARIDWANLWEYYPYAETYKIQVSFDAVNWTDVYSAAKGNGGADVVSFKPVNAQYVKLIGTKYPSPPTGYSWWGISVWEFSVYGAPSGGDCVPIWQCEIPLNGYEKDGCGNRRPNVACNSDSIPPSAPTGLAVN